MSHRPAARGADVEPLVVRVADRVLVGRPAGSIAAQLDPRDSWAARLPLENASGRRITMR